MMNKDSITTSCQKSLVLVVIFLICGCAGSTIPRSEYSPLETPQQTYEFAKQAVAKDDPAAFYYCLDKSTQSKFSLSELKLAWSLAGGFFYLFLDSKLKKVEVPAPEFGINRLTGKVTIQSHGLDAYFLVYQQQKKWHLVYPSPYPPPDISKIKRRKRLPWRIEGTAHYRQLPRQWFKPQEIKRQVQEKQLTRKPSWRTE